MAKIKVHELAKELNIQSKDIINYLGEYGIEIKSHMSNVEDREISMIRGKFGKLAQQEREAMKRRKELEDSFNSGVITGIKLMEQRMLLACENGTPIALSDGRAYFIYSDLQNLQFLFADLEADAE